MSVKIPNLEYIRSKDPKMYEAFVAIQDALVPSTQEPPPPVSGVSVQSLGTGAVDVTITDNGQINQNVNYFVEHDDNPNFTQPRVEHLGPSRTVQISTGNQGRYFRAYSQYFNPPSQPSAPIVFGGSRNPTRIFGGSGTVVALQPSTGSGTAATNGQQGGSGAGKVPVRPLINPKLAPPA